MEQDIKKNKLLADSIADILADGIVVSDAMAHFIETTFPGSETRSLQQILSDTKNSEVATLFQLLLYPDETIQMTIEPLLEKTDYTDANIETVIAGFRQNPLRAALRIPGSRGKHLGETLVIEMPSAAMEALVKRLKITRRIEPRIADALSRRLTSRSEIRKARVQLRNARFTFSEPVVDFLCRLIETTYGMPDFFQQAFRFIVGFLDEMDPMVKIYASLMKKKRDCRQLIRQALFMEKMLQESPVEAVMMRGEPILCLDAADARRRMDLIDRICALVFGVTDASLDGDPVALSAAIRIGDKTDPLKQRP